MKALRSLLFVPGNRQDMLQKAQALRPDALIPDMEDSVTAAEKNKARETVAFMLAPLNQAGHTLIPRINSLGTGLLEKDLEAVIGPNIYGVSVGKFDSARDAQQVISIVEVLERKAGLESGRIKLIPWIETAKAIVNAYEICSASPRIIGVAFGAEDFTADMEIPRSEESAEIVYPRSVIGTAAKAADVMALDTPYPNFRDAEGLKRDSFVARQYGFKGRFAIHPTQIETINSIFSPAPQEVEYAKRVVQAFEEAEALGRGATSLDGKLIDVPIVKRAQKLLALAESIDQRKATWS
ncbi:MAG: CoA ester lyase [Chloroflexi bacterium]|nr:CoA ester lyase [Chloroflexota bacterium]